MGAYGNRWRVALAAGLGLGWGLLTLGARAQTSGQQPRQTAPAQTQPPAQSQGSSTQTAPPAATIDLNDPKVRERLRARGINPDDLIRMLGAQATAPAPMQPPPTATQNFPPVTPGPSATPFMRDSLSAVTDSLAAAAAGSQYFGYSIFTMSPKTFEPLAFGPVSSDYLIGPGDELIVNVWGAQEMSATVEVNREGTIQLPDLGEVTVNGYTLEALKAQLVQRFARIYSGLRSDGRGRTSLEVSLGKLRSIQVFVLGSVVQPGGYTMSATSSVMNGLYYAGGPTLQGSMRNVRVMRKNNVLREVDLYDYIAHGDRIQDTRLENGDVVFVPPVGIRVKLEGEVAHAAIFELREGETLADLLRMAGGLKSTAAVDRVQIERVIPFDQRAPMSQEDRKMMDVKLGQGGRPGEGVTLVNGDVVRVFPVGDILKNTVEVVGTAVRKPGTYEHHHGMTVADLVDAAGGLLGDAYTGRAHVVRTREDKSQELLAVDLATAMKRQGAANLVLQERDRLEVFSVWDIRDKEFVRIEGMVRKPGRYDFLESMTVADLIVRAGGMRESAYRLQAEVSRVHPEASADGRTAEVLRVAVGDTISTESPAARFQLQKNDIVFIREIPNWSLQENVWVTGEVKFPGMYTLSSKMERLSSVIERAGGLEPTAYLPGANFVRKKEDTGRMALDFEDALKLRKKGKQYSKFDLVLAAGDSIHIPRDPKSVKVTGAVGFPSSVLYEKGKGLGHYIDQAGGLLPSADSGKIRVIMANGRVERPRRFRSPEPDAGAVVVVPVKEPEKDRETLKDLGAITTILTGAATMIYLISQTSK
jgi:polysaccharide export outer membrane protein